jgi:hypothetical protein
LAVAVSVDPTFKFPEVEALPIVGAARTVNAPTLVALPPPLSTTKLCVPAVSVGKVAVKEVDEETFTLVKATPFIVAVVCSDTKFVPVIVTDPPEVVEPVEGEIPVTVGDAETTETMTTPDPPAPPFTHGTAPPPPPPPRLAAPLPPTTFVVFPPFPALSPPRVPTDVVQ